VRLRLTSKRDLTKRMLFYTGDYHQIIYYLLKKESPTKYVHRSLLTGDNHIRALDIDAAAEFSHIMAQRPNILLSGRDTLMDDEGFHL